MLCLIISNTSFWTFCAGFLFGVIMTAVIGNSLLRMYHIDKLTLRRDKEILLEHYKEQLEQMVYGFHHKDLLPQMASMVGLLGTYSLYLKEGNIEEAEKTLGMAYAEAEKILIQLRKNVKVFEGDLDTIERLIDYVKEHGAPHVKT